MRRSKEIIVLLALLVSAMAFVLWYVIDRRAQNRAVLPAPATQAPAGPTPAGPGPQPAPPAAPAAVALQDHKTINFSTGQPVVQDSPADRATLAAALKDMAEATKGVTFGPAPRPATKPPRKPDGPPQS